ncbi:MAG: hypothetical protein R2838_22030 [Caldilineaceae bacterium]
MNAEELPDLVIRSFHYYYNQLRNGATGYIGGNDVQPVRPFPTTRRWMIATPRRRRP